MPPPAPQLVPVIVMPDPPVAIPPIISADIIKIDLPRGYRLRVGRGVKGMEMWLGKFGRPDNWFFCLTAAMLLRIRSEHDEANETDPQPWLQGEGGAGGDQG